MNRSSPRGFTLIELIVVIGIIILATGFIAPTLAKFFQNRALSNSGTIITNVMNGARNEAVTTKKPVHVVFLRDGLRIFKEENQEWVGGVQGFDTAGQGQLSYRLLFTRYGSDELRKTVVDLDEGVTPVTGLETDDDGNQVTNGDISLRFKPDGTIDFGRFRDVESHLFDLEPPGNADIIIDQKHDPYAKGFIDIRPTGRVVFKVAETEEG